MVDRVKVAAVATAVVLVFATASLVLYRHRSSLPGSLQEVLHYELSRYSPLGARVVFEGPARGSHTYRTPEWPYLGARLSCRAHRDTGKFKWFCRADDELADVLRVKDVDMRGFISKNKETNGDVEDYQVDIDLEILKMAPTANPVTPSISSTTTTSSAIWPPFTTAYELSSTAASTTVSYEPHTTDYVNTDPPTTSLDSVATTSKSTTTVAESEVTKPPATSAVTESGDGDGCNCCCCCRNREASEDAPVEDKNGNNGQGWVWASEGFPPQPPLESKWKKWRNRLALVWKCLPYILFLALFAYLAYQGSIGGLDASQISSWRTSKTTNPPKATSLSVMSCPGEQNRICEKTSGASPKVSSGRITANYNVSKEDLEICKPLCHRDNEKKEEKPSKTLSLSAKIERKKEAKEREKPKSSKSGKSKAKSVRWASPSADTALVGSSSAACVGHAGSDTLNYSIFTTEGKSSKRVVNDKTGCKLNRKKC